MNDCDRILQKLNAYLDGATDIDLDELRLTAQVQQDCLSVFEALLRVHTLFADAPMARSNRDFAASVTIELARRERRQKWALVTVIAFGAFTMLLPIITLASMSVALFLQPGLFSQLITSVLAFVSEATAIAMALLTATQHLPPVIAIGLMTILSASFLLLALASANRFHPEFVQTTTT